MMELLQNLITSLENVKDKGPITCGRAKIQSCTISGRENSFTITHTLHHIFGLRGQDKVVDKFLFNILPCMMCILKSMYSELLIAYGFVQKLMSKAMRE